MKVLAVTEGVRDKERVPKQVNPIIGIIGKGVGFDGGEGDKTTNIARAAAKPRTITRLSNKVRVRFDPLAFHLGYAFQLDRSL